MSSFTMITYNDNCRVVAENYFHWLIPSCCVKYKSVLRHLPSCMILAIHKPHRHRWMDGYAHQDALSMVLLMRFNF